MDRVVSLVWFLAGVSPLAAQDKHHADHLGQMFQARCAVCHTVPDTAFATDRAWLKQVNSTA